MRFYFSSKSILLLVVFVFTGCQSEKQNKALENWPISGGPEGTWNIQTASSVPTNWSVRNNQNIAWKTALPAGGQSGIAVWGDKLFLTINPPLDTPIFAESRSKFEKYSKAYNELFSLNNS